MISKETFKTTEMLLIWFKPQYCISVFLYMHLSCKFGLIEDFLLFYLMLLNTCVFFKFNHKVWTRIIHCWNLQIFLVHSASYGIANRTLNNLSNKIDNSFWEEVPVLIKTLFKVSILWQTIKFPKFPF